MVNWRRNCSWTRWTLMVMRGPIIQFRSHTKAFRTCELPYPTGVGPRLNHGFEDKKEEIVQATPKKPGSLTTGLWSVQRRRRIISKLCTFIANSSAVENENRTPFGSAWEWGEICILRASRCCWHQRNGSMTFLRRRPCPVGGLGGLLLRSANDSRVNGGAIGSEG